MLPGGPKPDFIGQPCLSQLGARLASELTDPKWTRVDAAIAYVKLSGVRQIAHELFDCAKRSTMRISVGIDQQGTSLEGLQTLWLLLGDDASELFVVHNPGGNPSPTFHPKLWLFQNDSEALLICGSGNLTGGGLFTNYEAGMAVPLKPGDEALDDAMNTLAAWSDATRPEVAQVTRENLENLHKSGELPSEEAIRVATRIVRTSRAIVAGVSRGVRAATEIFKPAATPHLPAAPALPTLPPPPVTPQPVPRVSKSAGGAGGAAPAAAAGPQPVVPVGALAPANDQLLIVVNPQNKTEIYLAKALLKDDPAFFGWPFLGRTTPHIAGNPGQPQPDPLPTADVTVYKADGSIAGHVDDPSLKLWTYSFGASANDDFRLTLIGGLQKEVPNGSILVMTRQPVAGIDYKIDIYPPGHADHAALLAQCTNSLPGGRRYGWK